MNLRDAPLRQPGPLEAELDFLLPKSFLASVGYERLAQMPRYLKALLIRAERARLNPLKDQERARQLAPYAEALAGLRSGKLETAEAVDAVEQFRWMIEEFKVSLFAQELGTAFPVSPKRLDEQLRRAREVAGF